MSIRKTLLLLALIGAAMPASAQLPFMRRQPPPQPLLQGIDAVRADFAAQAGGTTVYFVGDSALLTPIAKGLLTAQAAWIRRHPEVVVRVEGYAGSTDTRDYALAIGARRAAGVRDFLVLLGVPSAQVSATSWGKEKPAPPSATTVLLR
jgi:peptidoglycan-associated lipoprotein